LTVSRNVSRNVTRDERFVPRADSPALLSCVQRESRASGFVLRSLADEFGLYDAYEEGNFIFRRVSPFSKLSQGPRPLNAVIVQENARFKVARIVRDRSFAPLSSLPLSVLTVYFFAATNRDTEKKGRERERERERD